MADEISRQSLRNAWRSLVPNFDQTLALVAAREHLQESSAERFETSAWRVAMNERHEEFPEFFALYDYDWCDDVSCFDFPIETSYQVRSINAAIGLWRANPSDAPRELPLGRIVARSTYLANFEEATPHVLSAGGHDFLVCPLGWLEFLHRYFAGFSACSPGLGQQALQFAACEPHWRGIGANLVASSVSEVDYFLPTLIERIVSEDPAFRGGHGHLSTVSETDLSRDLAYAAHDFALCHEVAHVAARDFAAPDENRADRWGLAAYFGSWSLRPALHLDVAESSPLRASIGPFAFMCALRALLAARTMISKRVAAAESRRAGRLRTFRLGAERSRALYQLSSQYVAHPGTEDRAAFGVQNARVEQLFSQLLEYEVGLLEWMRDVLTTEVCRRSQKLARAAEWEARESA